MGISCFVAQSIRAAAFGPQLIKAGLEGGLTVLLAAAAYGQVAGCMSGGPMGKRLINRCKLKAADKIAENTDIVEGKPAALQKNIDELLLFKAIACIICMGIGHFIILWISSLGIVLPAYLGPMIVAALAVPLGPSCSCRRLSCIFLLILSLSR